MRLGVLALFTIVLFGGSFIVSDSAHAQPLLNESYVEVTQQSYHLRPTLEVEELQSYAHETFLTSPLFVFILALTLFLALLFLGHSRILKDAKILTMSEITYLRIMLFGRSLVLICLFLYAIYLAGPRVPADFDYVMIPIKEQSSIVHGDKLRVHYRVSARSSSLTDAYLSNHFSPHFALDTSSLLIQKDGTLPEIYLPLVTDEDLLIPIGALAPGEYMTVEFDITVLDDAPKDFTNSVFVTESSGIDITSSSTEFHLIL
jgi:hypothetical protein